MLPLPPIFNGQSAWCSEPCHAVGRGEGSSNAIWGGRRRRQPVCIRRRGGSGSQFFVVHTCGAQSLLPRAPGDLVFDVAWVRFGVSGRHRARRRRLRGYSYGDGVHCGSRRGIDRHSLREEPVEPDVGEAVRICSRAPSLACPRRQCRRISRRPRSASPSAFGWSVPFGRKINEPTKMPSKADPEAAPGHLVRGRATVGDAREETCPSMQRMTARLLSSSTSTSRWSSATATSSSRSVRSVRCGPRRSFSLKEANCGRRCHAVSGRGSVTRRMVCPRILGALGRQALPVERRPIRRPKIVYRDCGD